MDGWIDKWMYRWKKERWMKYGRLDVWTVGLIDLYMDGRRRDGWNI